VKLPEAQRNCEKHSKTGEARVLMRNFDALVAGMMLDGREMLNEGEMSN